MSEFKTARMPVPPDPAPDGSLTYPLVRTERASVGLIELEPGQVTSPVRHRSIEEVWYILQGEGQLWRRLDVEEEITDLVPGTCVTIPPDTTFQFRATSDTSLQILMVTVPPWPGPAEAVPSTGIW